MPVGPTAHSLPHATCRSTLASSRHPLCLLCPLPLPSAWGRRVLFHASDAKSRASSGTDLQPTHQLPLFARPCLVAGSPSPLNTPGTCARPVGNIGPWVPRRRWHRAQPQSTLRAAAMLQLPDRLDAAKGGDPVRPSARRWCVSVRVLEGGGVDRWNRNVMCGTAGCASATVTVHGRGSRKQSRARALYTRVTRRCQPTPGEAWGRTLSWRGSRRHTMRVGHVDWGLRERLGPPAGRLGRGVLATCAIANHSSTLCIRPPGRHVWCGLA